MSCVQLSEGGFQVVYPLARGPGSPELSKSYMDMASKLFAFTFKFTCVRHRLAAPRPARTWPALITNNTVVTEEMRCYRSG